MRPRASGERPHSGQAKQEPLWIAASTRLSLLLIKLTSPLRPSYDATRALRLEMLGTQSCMVHPSLLHSSMANNCLPNLYLVRLTKKRRPWSHRTGVMHAHDAPPWSRCIS
jgi:hypothetical protein